MILDTKTGKSYNLKLRGTYNRLQTGIIDDIYKTGFLQLNLLNKEGCFYFLNNIEYSHEDSNPIIYLVKLK